MADMFDNELGTWSWTMRPSSWPHTRRSGAAASATEWWLGSDADSPRRMPHDQFVDHLTTIMMGVIVGTAEALGIALDPDQPIHDACRTTPLPASASTALMTASGDGCRRATAGVAHMTICRVDHTEPRQRQAAATCHTRAVIIGTGFAGLGMAIALQRQGVDFVILEKADDIGGTWRDNSYPGCACDMPSHLYSFSFEPKPTWNKLFSPQPEILDYLKGVTEKYGLRRYIRVQLEGQPGALGRQRVPLARVHRCRATSTSPSS